MAVSTGKKMILVAILAAGYFIGNGANENKRYEELKAKQPSDLTQDDKSFIKKIEDGRSKAEEERKQYQLEQKKKDEADRPRREFMELQLAVRMACHDTASSLLKYPDSFKDEQHEDGIDNQEGKDIYYFTLHYSGVNSFHVRSTHTIECYGTIGDPSHSVTYRTFN